VACSMSDSKQSQEFLSSCHEDGAEMTLGFFLQVLLMGKSGSGKTSMRSIIFANYIARDTRRLGATSMTLSKNTNRVIFYSIFKEREEDLKRLSRPLACTCFRTSIWDETLYKAWSSIVYQLIPNVQQLECNLRNFAQIIEADEVLLFERATFLVISHYQCKEQRDAHRFEKISNIIKQFKLSCSKLAASFQSMEVRNSNFAAFIDVFTSNTYVMVIMSDPSIPSAATLINIRNARRHFEKLERVDGPKHSLHMRMR
uniref:Ras-related GTP-binding protein n=1 Tax=Sinocyclocheilus grahami TaxID=75366 RepID=A0A672N4M2_SINGR